MEYVQGISNEYDGLIRGDLGSDSEIINFDN